jgi:hypothetical protein
LKLVAAIDGQYSVRCGGLEAEARLQACPEIRRHRQRGRVARLQESGAQQRVVAMATATTIRMRAHGHRRASGKLASEPGEVLRTELRATHERTGGGGGHRVKDRYK